jgi:hypothetical protein
MLGSALYRVYSKNLLAFRYSPLQGIDPWSPPESSSSPHMNVYCFAPALAVVS